MSPADQDRATLLTCDGAGKSAKEAALNRLTNPADPLPAQIAEALKMLAERDGVSVNADFTPSIGHRWQVVKCRPIEGSAWEHEAITGVATTYEQALAACRAAEFTDGKGGSK